jgi:predicted DNA binding protein
MQERFERAPVGILTVDGDGQVREANDRARALLGIDAADSPLREVFPESVENTVPRAVEDLLATRAGTDGAGTRSDQSEQSFEEYYPVLGRWLGGSLVPTDEGVTVYVRDCSARHRDEQTIEDLRSELDRLSNINAVISDILAELVGASTREEIAETICERLGETDLYEFAWVGERELGGDDIVVRASAGTTGRTLDQVADCLDDDCTTPEQQAVETAEPQLAQPLGEDQSVPEPVRRAAFADGVQSLLAVPLTYGANVYGVVGIYAADQDAFSGRERANFATVGEMAGFAINATRHRNLLLSDTVVELDIAIDDPADPFLAAASSHDATLSVDGLVPQSDGRLLCYLSVEGTDPETVADELAGSDAIAECRVIGDYDEGGSLEVALRESSPLGRLAARGATIQSASFEGNSGAVTVELSPEEDVRRLADAVTREYDAAVRAKREREREITTGQEFRDELSEELTDRQESALRAAFFADYFESPRGSSAEEVAGALDITGPTLLYHLRAGQRKLLAEFFETTAEE